MLNCNYVYQILRSSVLSSPGAGALHSIQDICAAFDNVDAAVFLDSRTRSLVHMYKPKALFLQISTLVRCASEGHQDTDLYTVK